MEFSITPDSCRVCLRKSPIGKHLSEPARGKDHVDKRTLLDLFHLCTGFTDSPCVPSDINTFFPRKICAACEQLLLAAHEFRRQSTKTEKVLHNILQFYDDDEACSVLDDTVEHEQTQTVVCAEEESKREAHPNDGSADQEGTEVVDDTGLELLQEAALLIAEESQSNVLFVEDTCELVHEKNYEKKATTHLLMPPNQETLEHSEHPDEISLNIEYHEEEHVLEEELQQANADADAFDGFESMVDEDDYDEEDDAGDSGMIFCESKNTSVQSYVDCPDCKKLVSTRYLPKHRETHQNTPRFECDVCQLRFTFAENLAKHKRIHQNDKRYACPYCQELFLHWASRRYHISRVHTQEKRFACEYCGAKFRQSSHYQIHLRRHTGSTPYACSLCSRSFITKYSLKEHMVSHSDKKEFQCLHCWKLYKSMKSLKIHVKTHSNVREYVCSVCEKTFSQNHSLRKHQMHAHPELPALGTVANVRVTPCNRLNSDEVVS